MSINHDYQKEKITDASIDCLLVAYEGINMSCLTKSIQTVCNVENIKLESVFNAAIAYLATYINRKEITFDYVLSYENERDLLYEKLSKKIVIVALSTTFCNDIGTVHDMVQYVKKINPEVKVIVGGAFIATILQQLSGRLLQILLREINADIYINSFKGEEALAKSIIAVKNNLPLKDINNIIYKGDQDYVITHLADDYIGLENNTVDWRLFKNHIGSVVSVRTAISCPYACAYCSFHIKAGRYSNISVEAVERELDAIESLGKVRTVNFIDDSFNLPRERFKSILKMMIKKNYSFHWHSYLRCQNIDDEIVDLMKQSGCHGVIIGFESGNQSILDGMNKKLKVEDYVSAHKILQKYGIVTIGMFIIGFPGETIETVKDTIQFIEEVQPTFYHAHPWICDKTTDIWKKQKEYNIIANNKGWKHITMDSKTAAQLANEVFLTVKNSTFLNVFYMVVFQLLNQGFCIEDVKHILDTYNEYVKEKMKNSSTEECEEILSKF